jgi:hypothetical protein
MTAFLTAAAAVLAAKLAPAGLPATARPAMPSHPAPFDDRDRFLADLFGPRVEWLPPRTAPVEEWRTWLNTRAEAKPSARDMYIVTGISCYVFTVDPWVMEWLATPPGPSWRTLTDDGKWPSKARGYVYSVYSEHW